MNERDPLIILEGGRQPRLRRLDGVEFRFTRDHGNAGAHVLPRHPLAHAAEQKGYTEQDNRPQQEEDKSLGEYRGRKVPAPDDIGGFQKPHHSAASTSRSSSVSRSEEHTSELQSLMRNSYAV